MAITRKAIVAAMEKGIITANDKYEHWSNGSWVTDSGVESLMVTCIAETVNKCQGPGPDPAAVGSPGQSRPGTVRTSYCSMGSHSLAASSK